MQDIFISYRRDDSSAFVLFLRDRLSREFGTDRIFLDRNTIQPGANFPDRIKEGIAGSKVVLAVVGRNWLEPEAATGRSRLWNPQDWVRQEIELALQSEKVVIPILAQNSRMPKESDLPPTLAPLAKLNRQVFDGDDNELEAQWVRLLNRLLQLVEGEVAEIPPLLPALCDRDSQWRQIESGLEGQAPPGLRPPTVFILPGPADEAHDSFLERLERDSIPDWLANSEMRGKILFVRNREAITTENDEDFAQQFRRLIAREVARSNRPCSNEELLSALIKSGAPIIAVVIQVHAKEQVGMARLAALVAKFWEQFPPLPRDLILLTFVSAKFDPEESSSWFSKILGGQKRAVSAIRTQWATLAATHQADPRLRLHVLPDLSSPTLPDLDRWVQKPQVQKWILGRNVPVRRLQRALDDRERRPMDAVIPELELLLREYRGSQKTYRLEAAV